jgi:ferric-dicitrate binding protein FerR (iron transport regulator)
MEELNHIESVILHYLQGGISEDEMRRLDSWLTESNEHKQLLFELKNVYELRKGGNYPDKEEIKQSLNRLRARMNASGTRRLFGFYKYAGVAAVFVLLTLGVQLFFKSGNAVVYAELDVESGPRMSRLTLSDGTKVVLNASSKFKYPDRFEGGVREVFLDGEAFFDVAHDAKKPFTVRTGKQVISVQGTVFNVMDYSADDYAVTTLVSGSVRVQPLFETKTYSLKPNQQVFLNRASSEVKLSNVQIDTARTWVNKIYHFHDEPLAGIMQRLERFYGVKIDFADNTLRDEKYTGTFPTSIEIEEILKIINYANQFTYTLKDETITISSNPKKKMPMEKNR